MTSSGTSRPMAPLEYTLMTSRPLGSSTNPVDCRYTGSSLTQAPVAAAIARVGAVADGELQAVPGDQFLGGGLSSTDRAVTKTPRPVRRSRERWKARSWALQY